MKKLGRDPTFEAERRGDGRNVAPDLGTLLGEGALQRVREPERGRSRGAIAPSAPQPEEGGPSYYGLPLLAEPVWKWMIPAYFFVGGLAGACGVLGAAAQAAGGDAATPLVHRCRLVAAAGAAASAGLLVADLGRPSRFLNMLRVFRPTSPMNMGTWILSGFGACATVSALPTALPAPSRALVRAGDAAGLLSGLFGLPLVGYTGVLIANTAVPVWQGTRNTLPILFAFSGAVSAGSLLQIWPPRPPDDTGARFGSAAKAAEIILSFALDREAAGHAPRVARPLSRGVSGAMLQAARVLVASSLAIDLWPGRRRGGSIFRRRPSALDTLAGTLGLLGTALIRFGIVHAGRVSARDPRASFEMQRRGRGGAEEATRSGIPRMPTLPRPDASGKEPPGARP